MKNFPQLRLTIFAYGENRPTGVRYLSVTKAQLADFIQETKGFPNPSLPCKWVCLQSHRADIESALQIMLLAQLIICFFRRVKMRLFNSSPGIQNNPQYDH